MFIKSITIYNFKNYKNKYTFDLMSNPSENKNIVLIGGENGTGKTSILEAINLCLYGHNITGLSISKRKYRDYIRSLKNKYSKDQMFFINIELKIDESLTSYILTIKRVWELDENNFNERLYINRDGNPLEIIPSEYWQDYLLSLIPPYISQYFFFDGEKVREMASGNVAERVLKDSIKEIIGLNLYDVLYKDLSKLGNEIKRRNKSEEDTIKKLSENEKFQYDIQSKISELEKKILNNNKKIGKLLTIEKDEENELRRKAGAYAEERKQNEEKIIKINEKINNIDIKIKELCSDFLPFNMATQLNYKLIEQLEKEEKAKNILLGKEFLQKTGNSILKRIIESKNLSGFTKKNKNLLRKELSTIFKEMKGEMGEESTINIIHDLSPSMTNSILESISEFDFKESLEKLLRTKEKFLSKQKVIRTELHHVPDEKFVDESIKKITLIKTKINSLEKENSALEDEIKRLKEKFSLVIETIAKIEKKIYCLEEDNRKAGLIELINKVLKEYTENLIKLEIKELEEYISKMYKKLSNKKDMVNRIKINRDSFVTYLYGYNGEIHDKSSISEGEKEIYALSVLWSLSKISNRQLPIIIDSPLQKLDSTHAGNIITEFIPNAADQVIILSHDREIDNSSYLKIKPYINRSYTLLKRGKDKVKEGYFSNKFKDVNKNKTIGRSLN